MVLAQSLDSLIVRKSTQLLNVLLLASRLPNCTDFPVDVSLLFHTADGILHCSQTLCHIHGRTDIILRVINDLQTLHTLITLKRLYNAFCN